MMLIVKVLVCLAVIFIVIFECAENAFVLAWKRVRPEKYVRSVLFPFGGLH